MCADYGVTPPQVRWMVSRKTRYRYDSNGDLVYGTRVRSSGTTQWIGSDRATARHTHITMKVGSDLQDQRLVLLHELAHWLSPVIDGHSRGFWRRAWELYERYNIDLDYAWEREKAYKVKATQEAPYHVRERHEA